MGFFDKVKNMFTEEVEEEEVKVQQIKKEPKKVNIESPNVSRSQIREESNSLTELEEFRETKKEEKKPVFFTDSDFEDLIKEPKKEKAEIKKETRVKTYSNSIYEEKETKPSEDLQFKPSPIISPVYGILDKNYKKEDIVSKQENSVNIDSNKFTVDSVRDKAYGSLEDELESTLFGKKSILFDNDALDTEEKINIDKENESDFFSKLEHETEPNIDSIMNIDSNDQNDKLKELEDITMDIGKELDTLINKKEKIENIKNDDIDDVEDNDLFDLIDSMYEGDDK